MRLVPDFPKDWLAPALFGLGAIATPAVELCIQKFEAPPPGLRLRLRTVVLVALSQSLFGCAISVLLYLAVWLQAIQGASAVQSGVCLLASALPSGIAMHYSIAVGFRTGDSSPFMVAGFALISISAGLLSLLTPDSPVSLWLGYQAPLGVGLGFAAQEINLAGHPWASIFSTRMLGACIFTKLMGRVFRNKMSTVLSKVPNLDVQVIATTANATQLFGWVPDDLIGEFTRSYHNALTSVFSVVAATSILACVVASGVEWKNIIKGNNEEKPTLAEVKSSDEKV